jgi:sugar lactone lactonase YvrE
MKTSAAWTIAIVFASACSTAALAAPLGWSFERQSQSANISEAGGGPGGRLEVCSKDLAKYCIDKRPGGRACLEANKDSLSAQCKAGLAALPTGRGGEEGGIRIPPCVHSVACASTLGGTKVTLERVEWKQTMGYTFAYPYPLPLNMTNGGGGVSGVAMDSKGNLWAFQRNMPGQPQLFEFGPDHKLIRTVGEDVIGHQAKAHGIAVDKDDNVWICDASGSTVMKISPEGKLLLTIGTRGHRGDWKEDIGQRLLWQPMDLAFAPNGDIYIGEGHADESPNDVGSDDPTNNIGLARVIHLDRNGKFINQWFGENWGPGKFASVHGIGVDPTNGNVWIGDRDQYRIVIYTGMGKFVKTISMKNLVCAIAFDSHNTPWISSGNDGQMLKLDRDGNVLGAIGNGRGTGPGQFMETDFMALDKNGNVYSGDTTVARITEMVAPRH